MVKILDYAMQMEKDGEKYYRDLADQCGDTGLATILNMLADAEVKHYNVLQQMGKKRPVQLEEGTIRDDVKNIFARMMESGEENDFSMSEVELYKRAQQLEQRSRDFYEEKAEECDSPADEEIFYQLADEEELHYQLLDSIVEFISRPLPGNWLENAEWYHSEEY